MTYPLKGPGGAPVRDAGRGALQPSAARPAAPAAAAAAAPAHAAALKRWQEMRRATPRRAARIAWIDDAGELHDQTLAVPLDMVFEEACAAFARGTLIMTGAGPVAVEDLLPGDMIETRDNGLRPLRWIGSVTVSTSDEAFEAGAGSLRLMPGALGEGHPSQDLVLHHRARILLRHANCRTIFGLRSALAPARAFADGETIVRLRPAAPVEFFNIALDSHQIVHANGLEVESYHPGALVTDPEAGDERRILGKLFPHLGGRLEYFGPLCRPRLSAEEAETLTGL